MWISWERVCRLVDVVLNSMYSVYTIYIYLCAVRYRSKILALVRVFFFCCLAFCVNDCSEKLSTLLLLLVLCPFGWCCLIFKWFFMFVSMRLSLSLSVFVYQHNCYGFHSSVELQKYTKLCPISTLEFEIEAILISTFNTISSPKLF